jgi:hypothetical protein
MPVPTMISTEQASKMIVRACQATKKDVIDRCIAQMRKEKELIKIHYQNEMIDFKRYQMEMIDTKKFHKFAMALY